jgi:hypothetical protein
LKKNFIRIGKGSTGQIMPAQKSGRHQNCWSTLLQLLLVNKSFEKYQLLNKNHSKENGVHVRQLG